MRDKGEELVVKEDWEGNNGVSIKLRKDDYFYNIILSNGVGD